MDSINQKPDHDGPHQPSSPAPPALGVSTATTETQFFQIAAKIPLVLCIRDGRTGKVQYISPAYETIFGRPISGLQQDPRDYLRCVHPEDAPLVQPLLHVPAQPVSVEFRILRPDGALRWIRCVQHPVLKDNGTVTRIVGIAEDITERVRAHETMRLQHSALEASANAIVITDAAGSILWVNHAFAKMTGYSPDEVKGHNPRLLKSGKQDPAVYEQLWRTILSGNSWHGELRNKRKDGTLYDEELTVTPCRDAQGAITHFIAIKQDITERKQLEAQSLRGQRLETIGSLASGIAHDLNNVLAPVMMSVALLRDAGTPQERDKVLAILEGSVQHGSELIKQVLAFARGVANQPMLLQPAHLLKEFSRMIDNVFPKSIDIALSCPQDLHPIVADPTQIHQVLMNLCVNARDAMPAGGQLRINASNLEVDAAYAQVVPGSLPGPYVVFAVTDTGVGIPTDIRDKIFEPFFSTKTTGSGTGLGLTTTLAIVKAQKGFLHVYSEPGKGSTFKVHLPAAPSARSQPARRSSPSPRRGKGQCVLVADDEDAVRAVCKRVLERFGYLVLTARNGHEALDLFHVHHHKIQAIIMDLMMPQLDGAAAIQLLRTAGCNAPIIAASGLTRDLALDQQTSADLFLQKPWTAEALLEAVAQALARRPNPKPN